MKGLNKVIAVVCLVVLPAMAGEIKVGVPIHSGRLTVFPITGGDSGAGKRFITLDEGVASGVVKVVERGGGQQAQVSQLALENKSDRALLLLAGEIVTGGKQDRIVSQDRIIAPRSGPVSLSVFCVEPGRWHGASAAFGSGNLMAHPELRKQASEEKDQQKVWKEVGAKNTAMAIVVSSAERSTTSYARTTLAPSVQSRIVTDTEAFLPKIPASAIGMAIAVDGHVVWADIFPSAELFQRYKAKLLKSFVVEAYGKPGEVRQATAKDVDDFLKMEGPKSTVDEAPNLYRLNRSVVNGTVSLELESAGERLHYNRMKK